MPALARELRAQAACADAQLQQLSVHSAQAFAPSKSCRTRHSGDVSAHADRASMLRRGALTR